MVKARLGISPVSLQSKAWMSADSASLLGSNALMAFKKPCEDSPRASSRRQMGTVLRALDLLGAPPWASTELRK